jgi:Mce-associated membrane protein
MTQLRFGSADNHEDERVCDSTGMHDHDTAEVAAPAAAEQRVSWSRVLVYGLLPGLALVLAMAAGFLKWQDSSIRDADIARIESVAAAKQTTTALLSFRPDTIDTDVQAAQTRLTGDFRHNYLQVSRDVLIPNTKENQVVAVATVPAVAPVSITETHAVVLVFVDQTVTVGSTPPVNTTLSIQVTEDKVAGRWLISGFDPV